MSGLFDSLSLASNALDAQRMGLDVVGQNIANANTPGYARRVTTMTELAPTDPTSAGRGVTVSQVTAARDIYVDANIRDQTSGLAHDSAIGDGLSIVQTALGPAGSSIDGSLSAFFDSLSTLSTDPSSTSRDAVVLQGQTLATDINAMAKSFESAREDADAQVQGGVDAINNLAQQIADLNAAATTPGAGNLDSVVDQRTTALNSLAQLADVHVTARADNAIDVTIGNGRALVFGATTFALGTQPVAGTGLTDVTSGGVPITSELTGGSIGGQIALRDTLIPSYSSKLDDLAFDLAQAINTQHQQGFDATGAPGGDFFNVPGTAAGAALRIAVGPSVAANSQLVAASGTGTAGDNQNALKLAALRDQPALASGTSSAADLWAQLVYQVGADTSHAQTAQATRQPVIDQLTKLRDATSGVSIDQEATLLMQYQRAYEASARYFSTVNSTLDVLMNMVT